MLFNEFKTLPMKEFIDRHFSEKKPKSEANLQKRAQGFAAAVKEGYKSVYFYISNVYTGNISADNFYELLGSLSDSTGTDLLIVSETVCRLMALV